MCLKYKAQFFHYSSDNTAEIYLHSLFILFLSYLPQESLSQLHNIFSAEKK